MSDPDLTWVVEYQPSTAIVTIVTTKFPRDYDGAVELRDANMEATYPSHQTTYQGHPSP